MKTPLLLAAAVLAIAAAAPLRGAEEPLVGTWEGFLRPSPTVELRIVLKVDPPEKEGGPPRVAFFSTDQGTGKVSFPADPIAVDGKAVTFTVKKNGGSFSGTIDEAGDEIAGTWKQGPGSLPLTLKRDEAALVFPELWEGTLKAGPAELRLVVRITRLKGGALRATFDSPDQGAGGLKVDEVKLDEGTLTFAVKSIRADFDGKMNEAGTESVGRWKQGGATFPMTLVKVTAPTRARRPQMPKPPYPYDETRVTYENEAAGVTLAGTLTTPKGEGPFPAVLLITGSGAQDRDETLWGHKPFLVLADFLTRRGIAVLRVDDRGVGGSTGGTATATSEDFAGDVLAGVAFLKARKEVDPKRIGLLGHSEGGVIAPMVAVRSPDVAFIVLMAGTGVDGERIAIRQSDLMARAAGASEEVLKLIGDLLTRLIAGVKAEKDPKAASDTLRAIAREVIRNLPEAERAALGEGDSVFDALVDRVNNPWFRYFLVHDPRPTLRQVKCPVLALNGEKDLQVPAKENLAAIESALKDGGNTRSTVKELPGLNHLFQTCTTGAPSEYARIEETISPAALELIGDWVREQAGLK